MPSVLIPVFPINTVNQYTTSLWHPLHITNTGIYPQLHWRFQGIKNGQDKMEKAETKIVSSNNYALKAHCVTDNTVTWAW